MKQQPRFLANRRLKIEERIQQRKSFLREHFEEHREARIKRQQTVRAKHQKIDTKRREQARVNHKALQEKRREQAKRRLEEQQHKKKQGEASEHNSRRKE